MPKILFMLSNSRIDIQPDHLSIIRAILQEHLPQREVWVFGSRVTGMASATSDLDVAIIGDALLDFAILSNLKDALSASIIPYKVDIVDWAAITPEFQKRIKDDHVVLSNRRL